MTNDNREIHGTILTDLSLRIIAMDPGAETIVAKLKGGNGASSSNGLLPDEILTAIRSRANGQSPDRDVSIHAGNDKYNCTVSVLEAYERISNGPLLALHFRRCAGANEAMQDIAAEYELTYREAQALKGISMGLTCKEVAEQMNISPNTVKAFLRLIMIKMGVTRRSALISKVLEHGRLREGN